MQSTSRGEAVEANEILDAVDRLPPKRRGELTQILVSEFHAGPLPSPGTLAGCEAVVPGSGQKIVDMAVRQQAHDIAFETGILRSETRYRLLTLAAALFVLLALIGGAVLCAFWHETAVALTLGSVAGLSVLAGVIIKGRDLSLDRTDTRSPDARSNTASTSSSPRRPHVKPKLKRTASKG